MLRTLVLLLTLFVVGFAQDRPALQERDMRYRLQAGDTVEIQYRYTPEYNATAAIHPDGFLDLPLIGPMKVTGLTAEEAATAITKKASVRLNEPEVNVIVKDFVKPSYVVAGQVARPGRFEMRGKTSVIEAIAISGGFTESSKHSQVLLLRTFNEEYAETKILNVKELMTPKGVREDMLLEPGDILIVPQNTLSKLERYVRWSNMGAFGLSMALR